METDCDFKVDLHVTGYQSKNRKVYRPNWVHLAH